MMIIEQQQQKEKTNNEIVSYDSYVCVDCLQILWQVQ